MFARIASRAAMIADAPGAEEIAMFVALSDGPVVMRASNRIPTSVGTLTAFDAVRSGTTGRAAWSDADAGAKRNLRSGLRAVQRAAANDRSLAVVRALAAASANGGFSTAAPQGSAGGSRAARVATSSTG
jgi:hypothetical protein